MSVQPQQPEQLSLSLPYEEITSVLGRTAIRAKFKITSKESYKVPFADIEVRDGYNKRHVYEDMETAVEWVKANTVDGICELDPPLMVDFLEDGRVKILRGHRRFKAMQIAIEQGLVINLVVCTPTAKDMTELDRVVDIYTSNMHQSKLKPVEQADVCFSLKHNFDKISNEEIAAKLNISRQKVDYLLLIAEAGDDIKNEILHGDMTLTDAVAYVRKQKKLDNQTDQVEEDSHKNTAGKTPFPKDMLADEKKELDELDAQAEQMKAEQEVDEETGEVRMTNPDLKEYEKKPLDLVGNTVANSGKEKDENDVAGAKKFDESREEVAWCQNAIKLADKLEAIVEKLDVPDGTKKDVSDIVKWLQKDLDLIRDWVNKNKRQNKMR